PDEGRFLNHSCDPNCGVKGKFQIVAMRDIENGEELTFDYEMTEDSDWQMQCKCGSKLCRKVIGAYKNMPEFVKEKYKGYISEWLTEKYK
ncbi:MAG: SET domain-containing protein-lysine N-methyltransferase, partial [Candidatus Staskawiczbacteria bacterium]